MNRTVFQRLADPILSELLAEGKAKLAGPLSIPTRSEFDPSLDRLAFVFGSREIVDFFGEEYDTTFRRAIRSMEQRKLLEVSTMTVAPPGDSLGGEWVNAKTAHDVSVYIRSVPEDDYLELIDNAIDGGWLWSSL